MEIFYLFSVRYLRVASLTLEGVLGTPAVLIGVGAVAALQLAFTYVPLMQALFDTRPVAVRDGLVILASGRRCSPCSRSRSTHAACSGWTARDGARPGTRSPRADGRAPWRKGGGGRPGAPHPGGPRRGGRRSASSQSRSRP